MTVFEGNARFLDAHTMEVASDDGFTMLRGDNFVIACGTRPAHDAGIPIDGKRIFDSDQVHELQELPRELIVVGAGIIGLEYASMFAALGVKVTLLDKKPTVLDFADREIVESLCSSSCANSAPSFDSEREWRASVTIWKRDRVLRASWRAAKPTAGAGLLYSVGRQANSDQLNLESVGLVPGDRGKLAVDENYRTAVPNIYAAGDVIGFPALASTSMEQGRLASCHIFGISGSVAPNQIPYGVYTIPEISMVGATEETLTRDRVPYETGIARYAELAKGQMLGDDQGISETDLRPRHAQSPGSAYHRRSRHGNCSHWPSGSRARWHHRILPRYRLQLSHIGGGLQGRGPGRTEQIISNNV